MQCVNAYRNDFLAKITLFMQKQKQKTQILNNFNTILESEATFIEF